MSSARRQQHSRKHAKVPRQRYGPSRTPRERWTGPLRRLRRVIASSERLIEDARRRLKTSEQFARLRPIRTWVDLEHARDALRVASTRLDRAQVPLFGPIGGSGPLPRTLWGTRSRWFAAVEELDQITSELEARDEQLVDSLRNGFEWGGRPAAAPVRRVRVIPKPRTDAVRWFLIVRLISARDRISSVPVRRPRPVAIAIADAPRLVSRGRAPPSLSSLL